MGLQKWLFYIQKLIDICIPVGYMLAQLNFVFRLVDLPPSIVDVIHDPFTTYMWAVFSFVSYVMVVVGVIIKPAPGSKKTTNLRGTYIWFEFPGLLMAAIFTAIYPIALWVNIGLLGSGFAVICFVLTISFYFMLRFIRQIIILKLAKNTVDSNGA